jgi:uncharacterized membrane protein YfcA
VLSEKAILFILLGVFAAVFLIFWILELTRRKEWRVPTPFQGVVGFVTNFFDTLGIGSFATTTTIYSVSRSVADERLPGTLTVGHTIPTLVQAYIYITIVEVEMRTLALLIGASVLGSWLGAGVVTRLPRRYIQIGLGLALLAAAALILGPLLANIPSLRRLLADDPLLGRLLADNPNAGMAVALDGWLLAIGLVGNFIFGAFMTIGVGAYAPIMIMISLLGMNPKTAFPIMMGSCAFLMPVSGVRFVLKDRYDARAALGLSLGGAPAVLLAAFIVKELPLDVVRWLVVVVVLYTAVTLLLSARRERRRAAEQKIKEGADWSSHFEPHRATEEGIKEEADEPS